MLREITNISLLYYVQTNVLCELILIYLVFSIRKLKERTIDRKLFIAFTITTMIFTAFDLMTWVFDGRRGQFAYIMMHFSNIGFFISTTTISLLWCYYVQHQICFCKGKIFKLNIWQGLPLLLFSIFIIFNPLHNLIWTIDPETNVYSRGPLIVLHWVVVGCYLLIPTLYLGHAAATERSRIERKKYYPSFFILGLPLLCTVLQAMFYRLSLLQIGMASTILYTFIRQQSSNAYIDELTGIYNRRYYNHYLKEKFDNAKIDDELFMLMIDVDHFKSINDTYGHLMGDNVLKTVGYILRSVVIEHKGIISSRFGGDEFVIFGINVPRETIDLIIQQIQDLVDLENKNDGKIYVTISIGEISGKRGTFSSTDEILSTADARMYKIKNDKYNVRT